MGPSPEAQRAQYDAGIRDREWTRNLSPSLARTANYAIIQRPEFGGRKRQRAWADWLKVNLPQFTYDARRGWWQAPLAELVAAAEALPEGASRSKGVREYLKGEGK